ncbi:MAG: hypothetical protein WAT19_09230 [Ferruginibacter sp.]
MNIENSEFNSELNDLELQKRKLEINKANLELQKLTKENNDLHKPWYLKAQWWSALGPWIIGLFTIIIAFYSGIISIERQKTKIERQENKIDDLKKEQKFLEDTVKLLKHSISSFDDEVRKIRDTINILKTEASTLESLNKELFGKNFVFEDSIKLITTSIIKLNVIKKQLESIINATKDSLADLNEKYAIYKLDAEKLKSFYLQIINSEYLAQRKLYEKLIAFNDKINALTLGNRNYQIENDYLKMRSPLTEEDVYNIGIRKSSSEGSILKGFGISELRAIKDFDIEFQNHLKKVRYMSPEAFLEELKMKGIKQ